MPTAEQAKEKKFNFRKLIDASIGKRPEMMDGIECPTCDMRTTQMLTRTITLPAEQKVLMVTIGLHNEGGEF